MNKIQYEITYSKIENVYIQIKEKKVITKKLNKHIINHRGQ